MDQPKKQPTKFLYHKGGQYTVSSVSFTSIYTYIDI